MTFEPVALTKRFLRKLCVDNGGYATPALNDVLYLHYKGLSSIHGLEEYSGVKTLWLEGNAISKIEGIEHMTEIVCLFLQENCISTISGLDTLENIRQINLASNQIAVIGTGLKHQTRLENINLAHNVIESVEGLRGLLVCQELSVLDLTGNRIDDDALLELLPQFPNLRVLILNGNPLTRRLKHYRRRIISAVPTLTYLDSRPIFPDERRAVAAWARGGLDAERKERDLIRAEKRADDRAQFESMRAFMHGADRAECLRLAAAKREAMMEKYFKGLEQPAAAEEATRSAVSELQANPYEGDLFENIEELSDLSILSDVESDTCSGDCVAPSDSSPDILVDFSDVD